jgi:CrcB protein
LVAIGSGRLFGPNFPWGILIINVTCSFLIGLLVGLFASKWDWPQSIRIFLTVGVCGGYTTFSTFALDAFYLIERGSWLSSLAYVVASGSPILSRTSSVRFVATGAPRCGLISHLREWGT